jgi:hypothetical protein
LDVTLGGEIVDFGWLGVLNDTNEIRRVRHVAIMEREARVPLMRILIEMINAIGIE